MTDQNREKDQFTGTETTGHDWDGIKELDTPMPRWWLIIFYITVIWSIGYWVVYPAWPTLSGEGERGGTVGTGAWTQYKELAESQAEIQTRRAQYQSAFDAASFEEIKSDEALYAFGLAGGKSAFGDNCATCHGTGGAGASGYPNLNDDDWLWGGTLDDIYTTVRFGIRSDHLDTRFSEMPAFGEILSSDEVSAIEAHVTAIASGTASNDLGASLYADNCATCHGENLKGIKDLGAPNLADALWLYSGSEGEIITQIKNPKHGLMPAWENRLSPTTIRQLALYVHALGGGEE